MINHSLMLNLLAVCSLWLPVSSEEAFDILEHLGSKGPYRPPPRDETLPMPPKGCTAIMIAGVLRHGSRNPGKKDIAHFDRLQEKGVLGFKNPYRAVDSHLLVHAGAVEHFGIGSRMYDRFPHLFEVYHSREHRFRSSCHE